MKKEILLTADGSHTIVIAEKGITYHSIHGAVQESVHVFIEAGLQHQLSKYPDAPISVFEMGYGTGLNALLTAMKAEELNITVNYTAVETSPLAVDEAIKLNYGKQLRHEELYQSLHQSAWDEQVKLTNYFTLCKIETGLMNYSADQQFNLIYYDAFAPSAQPELWTKEVFEKMFSILQTNGVLITYCSKGDVRRAMLSAGFIVEKLPGPKGKREILRATKEGK